MKQGEKMKRALIAAMVFMPILSHGASTSPIAMRTYGVPDCGEWINQKSNANKSWLMGFLTGMNIIDAAGENPLARLQSAEQAFLWLDNYCSANPLHTALEGGDMLFRELSAGAKKKK